jgi:hypothetical protein
MTYKKFLVFKKDRYNQLKFIEIIDEGNFTEMNSWKYYLNRLADQMVLDKTDVLIFEFDDSNPCLELNYVQSIKPQTHTQYFQEIIDNTNYKKNNASDVITDI